MRKLIAWVFMYSLDGLSPTRAPSPGSFASACPTTRRSLKQELGRRAGHLRDVRGKQP